MLANFPSITINDSFNNQLFIVYIDRFEWKWFSDSQLQFSNFHLFLTLALLFRLSFKHKGKLLNSKKNSKSSLSMIFFSKFFFFFAWKEHIWKLMSDLPPLFFLSHLRQYSKEWEFIYEFLSIIERNESCLKRNDWTVRWKEAYRCKKALEKCSLFSLFLSLFWRAIRSIEVVGIFHYGKKWNCCSLEWWMMKVQKSKVWVVWVKWENKGSRKSMSFLLNIEFFACSLILFLVFILSMLFQISWAFSSLFISKTSSIELKF